MDLIKIATYLFSGTICLSMAIVLLFVKKAADSESDAYKNIKKKLAYSALIDVFVDILVIILLGSKSELVTFEYFIIPSAYCMQLLLMSEAILGLIHATSKEKATFNKAFIPLIAIMATYFVGLILNASNYSKFSFLEFKEYNFTAYGKVSCAILYIFIFICFIYCLFTLIKNTLLYLKKLNNYFSGTEVIKGGQIGYIAYSFLGYFILAAFDFIIANDIINTYIMIANTIIFICFVVFIMNIEKSFTVTQKLADFEIGKEYKSVDSIVGPSISADISNIAQYDSQPNKIELSEHSIISAIHKWEKRDDKPYLQDGILVSDVSGSLGLSDLQLSFVLNHSLKINFNTWINQLRVEESKNLIKDNPQLSLSDIAHASGFADLASFSKAFKKVTKESPSIYKKRIID